MVVLIGNFVGDSQDASGQAADFCDFCLMVTMDSRKNTGQRLNKHNVFFLWELFCIIFVAYIIHVLFKHV